MSILSELGTKFPCTTEGIEVPIDDENLLLHSGEVLESWFEADGDIKTEDAFNCLHEVLRMKEDYPYFVLHYIKVETRKITVQYSLAPMGAHESPGALATILIVIGAIFIAYLLALGLTLTWTRGYLWKPTGTAAVTVKDTDTEHGISGVTVYCDGDVIGTTDGYSVSANVLVGPHIFTADPIEGYQEPYPVQATIDLNKPTAITIYFRPEGSPEPDTGWLDIYTSPEGAEISVNANPIGVSPVSVEVEAPGDYTIGFGELEGYITPQPRTATVIPGERTPVAVTYDPEESWWQRYLVLGLTAAALIGVGAIVVPKVIKAIKPKETT